MKAYYETDKNGKHKIIDNGGGVRVRILMEPSESYIEKKKRRAKEEAKKRAEQEKKSASEKLIKDKMRELAIAELKKEGKL